MGSPYCKSPAFTRCHFMSVSYEDRTILMPFLDLPPVDETPLAKGKIAGMGIRCFLSSSVPPGSHSKHRRTLWQIHLHGSFLVGLTPGKQSRCLWCQPTSLELCTYRDEKLTGLTFFFQGQPPPGGAPGDQAPEQSSYPSGATHLVTAKSWGQGRVLIAPRGIHSSALLTAW